MNPGSTPAVASDALPFVSIIIPAFNEERFIGRCLEAVMKLDYPVDRYEVIVVDNGSKDSTVEIAQRSGAVVAVEPGLLVGAVRNRGAAMARGEVLAFLDADCVPDANWLAAAVAALRNGPMLTGSPYALPESPHWIEAAWCATDARERQVATHINAGNLIVPRATFLGLGGFDEQLQSGEDYELAQRAKQTVPVISDPAIAVAHLGNPKSLRQFVRREVWHGLGALGSLRRDWRDKPFWGTVAFALTLVLGVAGLISLLLSNDGRLLLASTLLLGGLLVSTVEFRLRGRGGLVLRLRLLLLYLAYYGGRMVALARLMAGAGRYGRDK